MEAQNRIPEEFIYHPQAGGAGSIEYGSLTNLSTKEGLKTPRTVRYAEPQPDVQTASWSNSGPWAQQWVHVDAPPSKKYQLYGRVPPQSWTEMAKEWLNGRAGAQQANRMFLDQPERYVTEFPPQPVKQEIIVTQPERFVIDEPPQPVYERVVYVPTPVEPRPHQLIAVPSPQQVVSVPAPQPILVPLESEIVCRGHPSDRTELCFGCTIPPRQLKYDIIREETSGCFGFCRSQRFKAVCRKCRAVMPPCQQCGKQSVIRHP